MVSESTREIARFAHSKRRLCDAAAPSHACVEHVHPRESSMKSPQPRERLSSPAAHSYRVGDFVSKSTDWRPYQVVDVSALSLEIERMAFHRAIATRIAMKIRRDRWVPLDDFCATQDHSGRVDGDK
jgi:hypothetical protein